MPPRLMEVYDSLVINEVGEDREQFNNRITCYLNDVIPQIFSMML